MKKNNVKIIISLFITIIIFVFLFHKISFFEVANSIENANFKMILLVLIISLFNNFFISSFRWKLILNKIGCKLSAKEALLIKAGSDPIISIVPFKIGEVSRVLYLKRKKSVAPDKTILSILIEYFLNLIALLFFIFVGFMFWFFQAKQDIFTEKKILFSSFFSIRKILCRNNWFNILKKYSKYYHLWKICFLDKKILFLTFLFGFFELLGIYFISESLGTNLPFFSILIYFPLIILTTSIPISFWGLGVREGIIILLFAKYAAVNKLFALSILYSFSEHILPTLLGLSLTYLFINRVIVVEE